MCINTTYQASMATHPQAFRTAMKELERVSKGAWEKMNELDPGAWSKAFFHTHSKADSTENNMSECFNSWIMRARYMPLIDMLTEIHDMIMVRLHKKRDDMASVDCVIVPRMKKKLDLAVKESSGLKVLWDGRANYVVKGNGSSCVVNLEGRTCSCRVWDLTGIPCCHAVTAIQESRQNPIDYVDSWYTKETYMKTYSNIIEVIKGEEFWEDVPGDTVLPPLIVKKLKGWPKKMRRREGWEGPVSKGNYKRMSYRGRKMHCGYCRKEGHKINVCPDKPADYMQPQSTKKRGRPKKVAQTAVDEVQNELDQLGREVETGEATMMDDLMNRLEEEEAWSRLENDEPPVRTARTRSAMKFVSPLSRVFYLFFSLELCVLIVNSVFFIARCQLQR